MSFSKYDFIRSAHCTECLRPLQAMTHVHLCLTGWPASDVCRSWVDKHKIVQVIHCCISILWLIFSRMIDIHVYISLFSKYVNIALSLQALQTLDLCLSRGPAAMTVKGRDFHMLEHKLKLINISHSKYMELWSCDIINSLICIFILLFCKKNCRKNCDTSNFHICNSFILGPIFIKFLLFCFYFIALFHKMYFKLTWTFPLISNQLIKYLEWTIWNNSE